MADGTTLPADLIIYATGYGPMNDWAAQLISPEVAEKIGPCWGLGSDTAKDPGPWEGELRNMWKPTKQLFSKPSSTLAIQQSPHQLMGSVDSQARK